MIKKRYEYFGLITIILAFSVIVLQQIVRNDLLFADEIYYAGIAKSIQENNYRIPIFYKRVIELPDGSTQVGDLISRAILYPIILSIFPIFMWKYVPYAIGLVTIICVFYYTKKFFSPITALFSSGIIAFIPLFIEHSILGYADMLFGLLLFLTLIFFYLGKEEKKLRYSFMSGICFGLALLTKEIALFVPFLFLVWILYYSKDLGKKFATIFFAVFLVSSLVGFFLHIRNYFVYGSPIPNVDLPFFASKYPALGKEVDYSFENPKTSLLDLEKIIHFYTEIFLFCYIAGFIYALKRRDKSDLKRFLIFTTCALFGLTAFFSPVLDYRYFLFFFIVNSMMAGYFLEILISSTPENYQIYIIALVIGIIIANGTFYARIKAETINHIRDGRKELFEDVFEWIKGNTEEDAVIMSGWSVEIPYFTGRNAVWLTAYSMPELPALVANKSDFIWDYLEKYQVDYLVIQTVYEGSGFIPNSRIFLPSDWVDMMIVSNQTTVVYNDSEKNEWILKINYD